MKVSETLSNFLIPKNKNDICKSTMYDILGFEY